MAGVERNRRPGPVHQAFPAHQDVAEPEIEEACRFLRRPARQDLVVLVAQLEVLGLLFPRQLAQ